jgi:hypothetical protein
MDGIIDATIDINVVTHYCEHNLDVESNHSIRLMDDEEHDDESLPTNERTLSSSYFARPIVVGYAFGPKKMSTMGVVMAEASKAKLTTVPEVVALTDHHATECLEADSKTTLTRERLCQHHEEEGTTTLDYSNVTSSEHADLRFNHGTNHGDLRHTIVQHVRALCSSSIASSSSSSSSYGVESSCSYSSRGSRGGGGGDDHSRHTVQTMCSTTTTPSSAHTTTRDARRRRRSSASSTLPQTLVRPRRGGQERNNRSPNNVTTTTLPIRVSFVPLDPGKKIGASDSM